MSGLKPDDSLSILRTRLQDPCSPVWPWNPTLAWRQPQEPGRWADQPRVFKDLKDLDATDRWIRQRYTSTPPQPDAI